ncbi:hypothetical protein AB0J52_06955 [Spirillospora sp. NPDC049652]
MPEPDEIRPAEAAADPPPSNPAPSAPPSFGHDEPAPAGGQPRIPTPFRLQAPWWAAESTDSDEPEPEEPTRPEPPAPQATGADADAGTSAAPATNDRLVAGQGVSDPAPRPATPEPTPRPARETVPDGTPVLPPGTGTGPQPPAEVAPQVADVPLPLAAPTASTANTVDAAHTASMAVNAANAANTDSRSSGPVLTPDAILPPGVALPPAVVLPPSERTVADAPKQGGPATVTDMPTVPPMQAAPAQAAANAPSASGAAQATMVAPPPPFPGPNGPNGPHAPNDGNTGPLPFPPGPLGERPDARTASDQDKKRKRLLLGGGVAAAVIVVVGALAASAALGGGDGSKTKVKDNPQAGASPSRPAGASPSAPVHHPVDINSEKTDTKPLALTEVFPAPAVQLGGHAFQRDRSSVNHQCGLTARGSMAEALAHDGCRSVVRVTFVSDDKKFAVTSGVAVLPNHDAAVRVSRAGNPGKYEWFRGLSGPRTPDIDGAGGYAAATVRGRYVAYAYATYTDGTRITPQDTQIKGLAQQFLDYGTKALDARARG